MLRPAGSQWFSGDQWAQGKIHEDTMQTYTLEVA